ncbi:MAG: HAD-IB family phosphatase [Thermoplasmata archaeon]
MSLVVLCDFDGTVVDIDTAEFVLAEFAEEGWREFDEQLEKGEITLEECLRRQFSSVRVPERLMLEKLERVATLRPGFEKLVAHCRTRSLPLIIVSGGLDFCIRHLLGLNGLQGLVEVWAAKAECTGSGIRFTFPRLLDEASLSLKDDLVRYHKKQGRKVIYIGDGLMDYHAVREADFSFVIRDSKLAQLCRDGGIQHSEVSDFMQVTESIQAIVKRLSQ